MDRTGADAFVFSKACGIYASSYVGARARKLFEIKRLGELWNLLFKEELPLVPEGMLALLIERKASERTVANFSQLLSYYDNPDPVSRTLLTVYDYNNVKATSAALSLGAKDPPFMVDIGQYSIIDRAKWPVLAEMTRGGPLGWYDRVPEESELVARENRVDHCFYDELWRAVRSLRGADRPAAERIVREEIILQNIVWAMRLKVYYGKTAEEIAPLLMEGELGENALDSASFAVDSWNEWKSWKYRWLLNPHEEGVPWTLDPRWAQLAADNYLFRMSMRSFHQNPFTPGVLVSLFKIMQLEEQMIRVATEGIRLGASESQMRDYMGDVQYV
jgi:vacuolar-type H+-ATPase subunit C/Vma6